MLALFGLVAGCAVFPDELPEGAEGGETDEFDSDGPVEDLLLADVCDLAQLPVISESMSLMLDFSEFQSNGLSYPKCDPKQFAGPDAFFILEAKTGERWNINAAPQDVSHDVSVVVLDGECVPTACKNVRDRCGNGFDEDTAIVATEDSRYIISVDNLNAEAGRVLLTLDKSLCGNGIVEPGESCEGDVGCDEQCRRVVAQGVSAEEEPNDIFTGVDMIGAAEEPGLFTIRGAVGGPCDEDHYAFIVPEGAAVSVHMYGSGGAPCPDGIGPIALPLVDFLREGGPQPIGAGIADGTATGACPYFDGIRPWEGQGDDPFGFARSLPASEYHLIVNAFETEAPIPYEIEVEIVSP